MCDPIKHGCAGGNQQDENYEHRRQYNGRAQLGHTDAPAARTLVRHRIGTDVVCEYIVEKGNSLCGGLGRLRHDPPIDRATETDRSSPSASTRSDPPGGQRLGD
jgi:hypothetical protein